MTNRELLDEIAVLLAGLQVPISLAAPIGAAREPWIRLDDELVGFGWHDADHYRLALYERFKP